MSNAEEKHNFTSANGYVPNEETAIAIAVAVWNPIYGKELIEKEKPYKAKLENDVWMVTGSVEGSSGKITPGGYPIIEINKQDGQILRVSHGK